MKQCIKMFSEQKIRVMWLLKSLSIAILSTFAVDAKDDSKLQSSFLSNFMTTTLFNSASLSQTQVYNNEPFKEITDFPLRASIMHALQDGLESLSNEMDSTSIVTDTYTSKYISTLAALARSSHSLIDMLLSGSFPDDFTNEADISNVIPLRNLTDLISLNSTLQSSGESSTGTFSLRLDVLLENSYPVNITDSHQALQMNNSSGCNDLSDNHIPTEETTEKDDAYSSRSIVNLIQMETTAKDMPVTHQDILQLPREPGKVDSYSASLLKERDESFTIGNVSGPVCPAANCRDRSHLCMCNQDCLIYKDCCSSYLFSMLATETDLDLVTVDIKHGLEVIRERLVKSYTETVYRKQQFIISQGRCVLSGAKHVLMIGLCPALLSNEEDKLKCEMAEDKVSIENIPVVQKDDLCGIHVHFKNMYCALCHNVSFLEVFFWDVTAVCEEDLHDNFTYSDMLNNCEFLVKPPEGSDSDIRTCIPNDLTLHECEPERSQVSNGREQNLVSLCQSYVLPIKYQSVIYRNMHCAACSTGEREFFLNGSCFTVPPETGDLTDPESLKILFDFSPKEGVVVRSICRTKEKSTCMERQEYDCLTGTCRTIYCHDENNAIDNCVPMFIVTVPIILPEAEPFLTDPEAFIIDFEINRNFSNITYSEIEYYISEAEKTILEFVTGLNIPASDFFVFQSNTLNMFFLSICVKLTHLLAMMEIRLSRKDELFQPVFKSIIFKNYVNESRLHCSVGYLKTTHTFILNHEKDTTIVYLYDLKSQANISQVRFKLSLLHTDNKTESISYCEINQTVNLNCQMVLLEKEEYRLEDGSLYLINTSKVYRNGTFISENRGAFVCADTLLGFEKIFKMFDYSPYQWILSIVAKALSMVTLLAIIAFHVIFPTLRNVHGLNLATLSATLLLAHGLLFIYHFPTGIACQATGVLLHFLWLSVFAWMNIIGFDVTRTFYSGRINDSFGVTRLFRRYLVVAFGIPLMLVTISVIFHILHGPVNIEYGKNNQCWLGSQEAVIIFFLVPIILSVSSNITLLGGTIFAIQRAKKMTELVRSRKDRAYSLVYFKLTVILGVSWFAGIAAVFADIPELWYVHIVCNGLQGLSIFICFALNARFLKAIRK